MVNRSRCLSPCSNLSPGDHGLINSRVIESEIVQTLLKKIILENNKKTPTKLRGDKVGRKEVTWEPSGVNSAGRQSVWPAVAAGGDG